MIKNNTKGDDAVWLKRFNEPAWNYQVVRFLNPQGNDIIPRKDRVWTSAPLAARMIGALEKAKRPVPPYLRTIVAEERMKMLPEMAFAMHCFWTGERQLGKLDGVFTTEAGWLEGREVTLVRYDPKVISQKDLIRQAAKVKCAEKVYAKDQKAIATLRGTAARLKIGLIDKSYRKARADDQKRQLQGTPWAKVTLSPMQATKVNAWWREDPQKAMVWVEPRRRLAKSR